MTLNTPSLWALFPVMAGLSYWIGWSWRDEVSLPGAVTKALATAGLAVIGAALGAPLWVVAGLALGSLGDFFLARPGERFFLAGMAAFAMGHLAYAYGLGLMGSGFGAVAAPQALTLAAIAAIVLSTERWLQPWTKALIWPVRGYVLVIAGMAAMAVLIPASADGSTARALIWTGVGLFALSDFLLSVRLFRAKTGAAQRALSLALWPAYWAGQALILIGTVSAGA